MLDKLKNIAETGILKAFILFLVIGLSSGSCRHRQEPDIERRVRILTARMEAAKNDYPGYDSGIEAADSLVLLAAASGNNDLRGEALLWQVRLHPDASTDTLGALLDSAQRLITSPQNKAFLALLRGNIEFRNSRYMEAYKLYSQAREYYHNAGETVYEGLAEGNLGRIYERLGNNIKAAGLYAGAQQLFVKADARRPLLRNRLNIFNVSPERAHRESAVLDSLAEEAMSVGDSAYVVNILLTRASIVPGDTASTMRAAALAEALENPEDLAPALINHADALLLCGDRQGAMESLARADALCRQDTISRLRPIIADLRASAFDVLEMPECAYRQLRLRDSLISCLGEQADAQAIHDMELADNISEYELRLEAERRNSHLLLGLIVVGVLAASVTLFLLASRRRAAMKRRRLEAEILRLRIVRSEEEKRTMRELIDLKNRELTTRIINLSYKNDLLRKIVDSDGRLTVSDIIAELKSQILLDNEWENFRVLFEETHPEFQKLLRRKAPSLTDNEIRLCSMTSIGLSIKQIANVLSISPESVQKARYRIKKKLQIDDDVTLNQYLQQIV